ncbi:60Kd inner membrane protein-domain-containing protein [Mycena vulgaris]|nr:60Kd inner membrane protein-domain-containing protein [Mycena vulgaris]
MLAVRSGLTPRIPRCIHPRQPLNRRFFVQSLCDGFLDLAIALPFPPSVPSYSATIILVTVASRLALFPVALWARNRVRRLENVVLPELARLKPIISKQVLDDMKATGFPRELLVPAKLQQIHLSRTKEKRLMTENKCHPFLSMVANPASQLPVFVIMTMMFNRLAQDPTPFDSEAFFTLTTLNHPDETWTLPILLGMITMANVESNNWLISAVEKDRLRRMEERRAQQPGATVWQPRKIIKSALNGLSVVRILLAAISPGSVVLYWTTSATCGLIQTWILDYRSADKPVPPVAPPASLSPNSAPATPSLKPAGIRQSAKATLTSKKPAPVAQSAKKPQSKRHSHSW